MSKIKIKYKTSKNSGAQKSDPEQKKRVNAIVSHKRSKAKQITQLIKKKSLVVKPPLKNRSVVADLLKKQSELRPVKNK